MLLPRSRRCHARDSGDGTRDTLKPYDIDRFTPTTAPRPRQHSAHDSSTLTMRSSAAFHTHRFYTPMRSRRPTRKLKTMSRTRRRHRKTPPSTAETRPKTPGASSASARRRPRRQRSPVSPSAPRRVPGDCTARAQAPDGAERAHRQPLRESTPPCGSSRPPQIPPRPHDPAALPSTSARPSSAPQPTLRPAAVDAQRAAAPVHQQALVDVPGEPAVAAAVVAARGARTRSSATCTGRACRRGAGFGGGVAVGAGAVHCCG